MLHTNLGSDPLVFWALVWALIAYTIALAVLGAYVIRSTRRKDRWRNEAPERIESQLKSLICSCADLPPHLKKTGVHCGACHAGGRCPEGTCGNLQKKKKES